MCTSTEVIYATEARKCGGWYRERTAKIGLFALSRIVGNLIRRESPPSSTDMTLALGVNEAQHIGSLPYLGISCP